MKKLLLQFVVVGIVSAACDDGSPPPPPPPPPPTTTIPPSPPPSPRPEDYYHLNHAGTYVSGWVSCSENTGMVKDICEHLCTYACWRDPQYVARHCAWGCADGVDPIFDLSADDMHLFGVTGLEFHDAGKRWMTKLPKVNRRCEGSHAEHDPRFCQRSNVRKTIYPDGQVPPFKRWQEAFAAHREQAYVLRTVAQGDPARETCDPYDSIAGWCQCRNKNGGPRNRVENGGEN